MKKVLFISGYQENQRNINGFMQLYNEFSNNEDYHVNFISINKVWKSKLLNSNSINIFIPFLCFNNSMLKRFFVSIPENIDCDYLFVDSEAYIISIIDIIMKRISYKHLIYRQSDPISFVAENKIIKTHEKMLIEYSEQVWVPNDLFISVNQYSNENKFHVLENPIKISDSVNEIDIGKINKIMKLKNNYNNLGIYYGKFQIDTYLINKTACLTPDVLYVIYGDYYSELDTPDNVVYMGFESLSLIYSVIECADFMFLPYKYKGKINDILYVTAKILAAKKFNIPVIASNVASRCSEIGISIVANENEFVECISNIDNLVEPNIDLDNFREELFYKRAKDNLALIEA